MEYRREDTGYTGPTFGLQTEARIDLGNTKPGCLARLVELIWGVLPVLSFLSRMHLL